LMLFNDDTTLTLGQIRSKTHIPDNELRRHLISLTTPKQRILLKGKPEEKTISSDDEAFTFNEKYKNKAKRIRVHLVKEGSLASSAATTKVPVAVEEDRRHLVEAAIVRIMKARKSLSHNDLIAEVTRQLNNRFSPSPVFIKKRIESLIEREYVERSPNEHRVYLYVA
jgi:cullin 3